ncbi:MAG: short-chain dehydrogenase [Zetaproteobacteria bacterium CG2_30_46_52]|nr:MAG: short-chain dehydrogenase [Zetaproteobacteria bacterium CG2_30_46_52]
MNKLQNKWALITGSSRGIGQQIALGLAAEGCNIVVHASTLEHTQTTLALLSSYPVQTLAVAGELGNIAEEEAFTQKIIQDIGHIDILYNNAAVMSTWDDNVFNINTSEWHRVFEVNVFSMVRMCNAFIPAMRQRGWGRVVNLSSGIKDTPQLSPYSVSKAAVDKYTQDLAAQLRSTNVLVNALDPGWLKTDLGGEFADFEVDTVLPGAIVPALLDDFTTSGIIYHAQDFKIL